MITGTATIVDAAMTWPQSIAREELCCTNPRSHSGNVSLSALMMTSATVNSFQHCRKANTPAATRPGASSGSVIRRNACVRLSPSTMAASSSSAGTPATNPRSIHTVNGTTAAM